MKYFLSVLLAVILCNLTQAAESLSPEEIAAEFFDKVLKGDNGPAIETFFSTNPPIIGKAQELQLLKSQLNTVTQVYGQPYAVEAVLVEDLTASLQRRVYITKHEWHPVTWEMYFYKPKAEWIADRLLFVDQYQVIGRRK